MKYFILLDHYRHKIKAFRKREEAKCFREVMGRYDWQIVEINK